MNSSRPESISAQELKYPKASAKSAPCIAWIHPQVKPRVALLCIHGLGLHKGTFAQFAQEMCKDGITTYALDMRGFGEFVQRNKHPTLDFDGCLADVKAALEQIHKDNPGLPVMILGESMGGAIALKATALYPELISGLVSSVPAGDRFSLGADAATKVGFSAIFRGMNAPIENIGEVVVKHATKKTDLRRKWTSDPLVRLTFTPKELLQFNSFMDENFDVAASIKETPILFIQGANDRLVRPAGTWKLFDRLSTPNKQLVLSKTSEHLIFEEGQFSPEDLSFVKDWITRTIVQLNANEIAIRASTPASVATSTTPSSSSSREHKIEFETSARINYWIELFSHGKNYRCNNKMVFQSGDVIRFHLIPETDGYAYLIMKEGTTGKCQLLFPHPEGGTDNFLRKGTDYCIPKISWLQFDKNPGTEKLSLIFSTKPIDISPNSIQSRYATCYVSADNTGSKDLVPTRMSLTWDDPQPVLIPNDFAGIVQIGRVGGDSSLVRMTVEAEKGVLSADIALTHQ